MHRDQGNYSSPLIRNDSHNPNHQTNFDKLVKNKATSTSDPTHLDFHKDWNNLSTGKNKNIPITSLNKDIVQSQEDTHNLSSDNILPLLKYLVLSDVIIQEHKKLLSMFIKLLVISSLMSIADGLWIEFSKDMFTTFTGTLLRTGTYSSFPLHYCIIVNGCLGFIFSIVCIFVLIPLVHHPFGLAMATCFTCATWAVFALVYNFGANIIYEDLLEDIMIQEMQKSSLSSISPTWRNAQKFFKCCGINSFTNWRTVFGNVQDSAYNASYPHSCCARDKVSCNGRPVQENDIWPDGCLELETFAVMSIGYSALLISTLQFLFTAFTLMTLIKLYYRLTLLKKHTMEILLSETVTGSTVDAIEEPAKDIGGDTMSVKDYQTYQIKKSSTV